MLGAVLVKQEEKLVGNGDENVLGNSDVHPASALESCMARYNLADLETPMQLIFVPDALLDSVTHVSLHVVNIQPDDCANGNTPTTRIHY